MGQLDGASHLQIQVFLRVCGGLVPGQAPTSTPVGFSSLLVLVILMLHGWHGAVCPAHLQIQTTASGSAGPAFPQHLLGLKALGHPHSSRELKSETREH